MEQEHMIRPYDTDMLAFSLANQGIEGLRSAILWINEEKKHASPWIWGCPALVC